MLTVNNGLGLVVVGVLLYLLGAYALSLPVLVTLGGILVVVGLVVVLVAALTGRRSRSRDRVL